ncbi:MAG: hypothetical protein CVU03_00350 [Bacteroidetes bacterium HGW-Bacteroidetes-2]|nr:MAG: hypothetical protein CVU03_00350 [Bacteroidetes bacterium HGW-Bacteroidetes-2]
MDGFMTRLRFIKEKVFLILFCKTFIKKAASKLLDPAFFYSYFCCFLIEFRILFFVLFIFRK